MKISIPRHMGNVPSTIKLILKNYQWNIHPFKNKMNLGPGHLCLKLSF